MAPVGQACLQRPQRMHSSASYVVVAALGELAKRGEIDKKVVADAIAKFNIDADKVKSEQIELFDICRELNRFVYSGGRRKYYQITVSYTHLST